jgi:hypothetical protein
VSRRVPIDEGPQSVRRYHKAKQESVMRTITTLAVGLIVLTACNKPQNENRMALKTFDVMEAPPPAADIKITHPEIAYTYSYTFRLPAERIADAQRAHIALCDQVGFAHCHMLQMNRDADGIGTGGSLKLEVDAAIARKFGHQMSDQVAGAGGAQVGTSITAEDLSKQIVDTEARLRSKELLAARLTELLRTRKGPVGDLVAAERGVADVQEEIDGARTSLATDRGRVAMSTIDVSYRSNEAFSNGFSAPIREALDNIGAYLSKSLALLMVAVVVAIPWLVVLVGLVFAFRRLRQALRRRKAKSEAAESS